jgi:hypothetical protein
MAIHCQCRPVITDKVVDTEIEAFALDEGAAPSVGQMAKRLSIRYGKPKCEGCTCKLAGNIQTVMARLPAVAAIAAE